MAQAAGKVANAGSKMANSMLGKGPKLVKNVTAFAQPRLATFWRYAKVEMKPPSFREFGEVQAGFGRLAKGFTTGAWKRVTVKEATVNACITAEIAFWFFVGEIIGRRSLVGYSIPGAVNYEPHV